MFPATLSNATIGDKTIALVTSLIIPDDQEAHFTLQVRVGGDSSLPITAAAYNSTFLTLNISMKFIAGAGELTYNFNGPYYHFTFCGWKNPMGNALKVPLRAGSFRIGANQPVDFGFMIANHHVDNINLVTFQILTGGKYEQLG
jgi:hypothetical protein